jgi:hypothetical protein
MACYGMMSGIGPILLLMGVGYLAIFGIAGMGAFGIYKLFTGGFESIICSFRSVIGWS